MEYSEVTEGLWQGGSDAEPIALSNERLPPEVDFDTVVTLDVYWDPKSLDVPFYIRWPIEDGPGPQMEGGPKAEMVRSLARFLADIVRAGQKVLVHCTGGLNRSGLVVARTLMELGRTPDEAIDEVRAARSVYALSNPHFTAWLQREGPSLAADLATQEAAES